MNKLTYEEVTGKLARCEERCRTKSTDISLLCLEALYQEKAEHKQYYLEEIMKIAMSEKGFSALVSKIPIRGVEKLPPDTESMWERGIKP